MEKRYPRTLQEAFGPYTSSRIDVEPPQDAVWARRLFFAVLFGAVLAACVGCSRSPEYIAEISHKRETLYRSNPDELGVACYYYNDKFSCVKVTDAATVPAERVEPQPRVAPKPML